MIKHYQQTILFQYGFSMLNLNQQQAIHRVNSNYEFVLSEPGKGGMLWITYKISVGNHLWPTVCSEA